MGDVEARATSVLCILPMVVTSGYFYYTNNYIDWKVGIFCAIGGDDTVRLLPYIDYEVIKNNPKIFMGYSDTTVNHLMMNKAGLVSFYGPSVMVEFGEYEKMFDYTRDAVENILFNDCENFEIKSSEFLSKDFVPWKEENISC